MADECPSAAHERMACAGGGGAHACKDERVQWDALGHFFHTQIVTKRKQRMHVLVCRWWGAWAMPHTRIMHEVTGS